MRSMSKVRNLKSWNPVDGKLDHCMATSGGFKSHLYTITVSKRKENAQHSHLITI